MAIRTQQSISGFIASDPQLSHTERGDARLYLKIGIEHYRREEDKSYTQMETTFHDLIAYRGAAEQGAERLAKGDSIVATGRVREYSYERNGRQHEGEEFIATRIGHDLARTRYDVDRTPRNAAAVRETAQAEQERAFDPPPRRPTTSAPVLGR
jgi:single-stranded DNA-binding protein